MEEPNSNTDPLMTADEVAEYLSVETSTVKKWAKLRKIPVQKVGSLNRFRRSAIDAWLEKQAA